MKRLLLLILYTIALIPCKAQTIVCDTQDGQPIIQASVYDEQGKIIGVTDIDGRLPDLADATSIRITHIAYHPAQLPLSKAAERPKPPTQSVVQHHVTPQRPLKGRQRAQQRRFAHTVTPQQARQLTPVDSSIQPLRHHLPVTPDSIAYAYVP